MADFLLGSSSSPRSPSNLTRYCLPRTYTCFCGSSVVPPCLPLPLFVVLARSITATSVPRAPNEDRVLLIYPRHLLRLHSTNSSYRVARGVAQRDAASARPYRAAPSHDPLHSLVTVAWKKTRMPSFPFPFLRRIVPVAVWPTAEKISFFPTETTRQTLSAGFAFVLLLPLPPSCWTVCLCASSRGCKFRREDSSSRSNPVTTAP